MARHPATSLWIRPTLEWLKTQEARGEAAIRALLHLRSTAQGVDSPAPASVPVAMPLAGFKPANYSTLERTALLELARRTLICVAACPDALESDLAPAEIPPKLAQNKACFVTLTEGRSLRGCYGNLRPQTPLYQAVIANTRNAALRDPRFPPVEPEAPAGISIEISVLTEPQPLHFSSTEELLDQLQPGQHGVLLRLGATAATFLPQVWTRLADKVTFMDRLAEKAGAEAGAWRGKDVAVSVYETESFAEGDLGLPGSESRPKPA